MQANRAPLETYEQAVFRLVQYVVSERYEQTYIDLAVEIVADIYWISDKKVHSDVSKAARGLGFVPVAAPRDRFERSVA